MSPFLQKAFGFNLEELKRLQPETIGIFMFDYLQELLEHPQESYMIEIKTKLENIPDELKRK